MALPAQGFKSIYKNSIENVSEFLREKHGDDYLIVNLGEHQYDHCFFQGNVVTVPWTDHEPIQMVSLIKICLEISIKLIEDPKLIIAAHCRAGKGRTGTFVSCLILLFDIFDSVQDVKAYYEEKRQVTVTKKSQLRNIFYFWDFINGKIKEDLYIPK